MVACDKNIFLFRGKQMLSLILLSVNSTYMYKMNPSSLRYFMLMLFNLSLRHAKTQKLLRKYNGRYKVHYIFANYTDTHACLSPRSAFNLNLYEVESRCLWTYFLQRQDLSAEWLMKIFRKYSPKKTSKLIKGWIGDDPDKVIKYKLLKLKPIVFPQIYI